MSQKGGAFRKKKLGFTQVTNNVVRNEELSLKAKGLYTLIQSYITLEDFTIYKDFLMSKCQEGEKAFNSTWKELKDNGYLKIYRIPSAVNKGKFEYEYDLLDEPDFTTPSVINLKADGSFSSDNSVKTLENTQIDHTYQNGSNGENKDIIPYTPKSTLCLMDSMLNGGNINNTDLNNTYCKYVSMYEEYLKATTEIKELIKKDIAHNIDLDLFEKIIVETINNNTKTQKDAYIIKTLKELIKKGVKSTVEYEASKEIYKQQQNKTKKSNSVKETNKQIKTRHHNINQTFTKYTPQELEELLLQNQKDKFKPNFSL